MEIVAGALPSLLPKLAELLAGEYNLQKEVKGGIIFLQAELESMQGALEKIAKTPADKLDDQDKVWARKVKEMSYDIEDTIDTYMVRCKGKEPVEQHGFKKAIDKTLKWFRQPKIRRKIAKEIREIRSRVIEVHERRHRYEVSLGVDKPVTVDPRLFAQYTEVKELVGIGEARDELINKIFIEENEVPLKQGRIVSIVGFGGLGKTTLANAVYKKIRAQFDCYAFVSVSQTPDLKKLYNSLLYDLGKSIIEETLGERRLIEVLREFLEDKRYFVVVDDVWDISVWKMIRCALPVAFQHGAMPRLRELGFWPFYVEEARGIACNDGSLDLGLGNLPSLHYVKAHLQYDGAGKEEAEQAKAALMHEVEMHPNRLYHSIHIQMTIRRKLEQSR